MSEGRSRGRNAQRPTRAESNPTRSIHFPTATEEDVEALRDARRRPVDPDEVWRLLQTLEGPTVEQLRGRPSTQGAPFRWPHTGDDSHES